MTLRKHQSAFAQDASKLINYARLQGYEVTIGEVTRPSLLQSIYRKMGKTWTSKSQHNIRLAIDINLFKDGKYLTQTESHRILGKFWEKLSPWNVWGGRFRDGNHYERRHDTFRIKLRKGKYNYEL